MSTTSEHTNVKWYHYVATFLTGMVLANVIPHYVNGISGNPFPSPFGTPPGFGNSSPLSNVLWGAVNLLIGYLLFSFSRVSNSNKKSLILLRRRPVPGNHVELGVDRSDWLNGHSVSHGVSCGIAIVYASASAPQ